MSRLEKAQASVEAMIRFQQSIPRVLAASAAATEDLYERACTLLRRKTLVVTGVGGSEWPARLLAWFLEEELGRSARFVPLSQFITSNVTCDGLLVFSQYLSNNTAFALSARTRAYDTVVATALSERSVLQRVSEWRGVRAPAVVTFDVPDERALLFRPVGPVVMAHAALSAFADAAGMPLSVTRDEVAGWYGGASHGDTTSSDVSFSQPCALVSVGSDGAVVHALRWKLLETIGLSDLQVWDAIQFVHGALQSVYEHPRTFVTFGSSASSSCALLRAFEQVLVKDRHATVCIEAPTCGPARALYYDACVLRMIDAELRRRPRDLLDWPGKGRDGAMYALTSL